MAFSLVVGKTGINKFVWFDPSDGTWSSCSCVLCIACQRTQYIYHSEKRFAPVFLVWLATDCATSPCKPLLCEIRGSFNQTWRKLLLWTVMPIVSCRVWERLSAVPNSTILVSYIRSFLGKLRAFFFSISKFQRHTIYGCEYNIPYLDLFWHFLLTLCLWQNKLSLCLLFSKRHFSSWAVLPCNCRVVERWGQYHRINTVCQFYCDS